MNKTTKIQYPLGVESTHYNRPFFGKTKKLLERIHSLDEKWYVEFWEEHYFFFGIDIYSSKREVVKQNGQSTSK